MESKSEKSDVVLVSKKRTVTKNLPCKLTEPELRDKGDALASVIQDLKSEEDRQVDIKAQMKARMAELDAKKTQLAISISRREEHRDVEVEEWLDYARSIVQQVRTDTGEIVFHRPMNEEERQLSLPVAETTH